MRASAPDGLRAGSPAAFALVAGGGAVGGVLRHLAAVLLPDGVLALTAVNVLGSFALGVLVAGPVARGAPAWVRPTLGTGLLGGFTTFSAVSWAASTLPPAHATGLVAAQVVLAVVAAALGVVAGGLWASPPGARRRASGG